MKLTKAKELDKLPELSVVLIDGIVFQVIVRMRNKNFWSSTIGETVLDARELLKYSKDNDAPIILIYEGPINGL